jgi:hypothetical protein
LKFSGFFPSSQIGKECFSKTHKTQLRNIRCLFEFLSNRRFKVVVKVRLEFKLLSTTKIAGDHLLTLNLKNVGSSILKNLVVRLHTSDPGVSVDCAECFIYALMPSADENVKFRASVSSLARAYFSVYGYASGDAYFSIESPVMAVQTKDAIENSMLLM